MENDPARIGAFMLASTIVLATVILLSASFQGGRAPSWPKAASVAALISVIGILFGKFGANFGLPWQIYYSVPALATIVAPPVLFRFTSALARLCGVGLCFCALDPRGVFLRARLGPIHAVLASAANQQIVAARLVTHWRQRSWMLS
jgi:hypothetical protein